MMRYHFEHLWFDDAMLLFENDNDGFVIVHECYVEKDCVNWLSKNPSNALEVDIKAHKDNGLLNRADNNFHEILPLIDWRTPAGAKQIVDELLRRGFSEHDLRYGVPTAEEREALKEINTFELVG